MTVFRSHTIHLLVVLAALLACNETGNAASGPDPAAPASSGVRAASPLQTLLTVFAARTAAPWSAFDAVPGVRWRDRKAVKNPDAAGLDTMYDRSGHMLLSGFGMVDVPDGKVGAEAGTKKANEGDVGVTLNGNATAVQSIALLKFYPSEDAKNIIQRQLNEDAVVKPVAGDCAMDYGTSAANTQKNAFYKLSVGAATSIYAETYIEADGGNQGPGNTTFVFYRANPTKRIAAMHCKDY